MPHPTGILTYTPTGQFNLPRSYVPELHLYIESHLTYSLVGNEIQFLYSLAPTYRAFLKIRDVFWNWSSNTYSLDHIVEWAYQTNFTGDTETSFALHVAYEFNTARKAPAIRLQTISPALNSWIQLPQRNVPYWLFDFP